MIDPLKLYSVFPNDVVCCSFTIDPQTAACQPAVRGLVPCKRLAAGYRVRTRRTFFFFSLPFSVSRSSQTSSITNNHQLSQQAHTRRSRVSESSYHRRWCGCVGTWTGHSFRLVGRLHSHCGASASLLLQKTDHSEARTDKQITQFRQLRSDTSVVSVSPTHPFSVKAHHRMRTLCLECLDNKGRRKSAGILSFSGSIAPLVRFSLDLECTRST